MEALKTAQGTVREPTQNVSEGLTSTLGAAERWISGRRAIWERRLDRLDVYLAAHPDEPNERSKS